MRKYRNKVVWCLEGGPHPPYATKRDAQAHANGLPVIKFDSLKEWSRYTELLLLQQAGEIEVLKLQPKFELQPAFKIGGKTHRAITYIADFSYYDGRYIIEDTKGARTDVFNMKEKLFLYRYRENFQSGKWVFYVI